MMETIKNPSFHLLGVYHVTFQTDGNNRVIKLVARNFHHAIRLAHRLSSTWDDSLKYELTHVYFAHPVISDYHERN